MLLVLLVPYAASTASAVTINSTSALCHCVASADVADAGAVSCLGSGRVTAINSFHPSVVGQLKVQVLFVSSLCPSCGQRLHSKVCHNKERAQE